jgi:hypothetical protein
LEIQSIGFGIGLSTKIKDFEVGCIIMLNLNLIKQRRFEAGSILKT